MNILFIGQLVPDNCISKCSGYSAAGNTMIKNIVQGLEQIEDVHVDVISMLPNASFPRDKIIIKQDVSVLKGSRVFNQWYINIPIFKQIHQECQYMCKAKYMAKKLSYDVVVCFNMYQQFGNAALKLERSMNIPLVSILADFPVEDKSAHSGGLRLVWNRVKKKTFANIKELRHAILLNENAKKFLNNQCDYIVIPGGVSYEKGFKNKRDVENRTIVYAGALTEYSGVRNLIQAVKMIDDFECELQIYGDGELKDYVLDCQSHDCRIKYMGVKKIEDMRKILGQSWILVNPRSVEDPISQVTFPSKTFEYIMSGRPVISTKFAGIPDDIERIIFSCGNGSPYEIKEAIYKIKNMREEELHQHVEKSIEYLTTNMTWDKQCQKIYSYFCRILG